MSRLPISAQQSLAIILSLIPFLQPQVRLRLKDPGSKEADNNAQLEALAGELVNELLNQVLRMRVGESTARIREYYMARAFFASDGKSTIDQLLAELDAEEMAEAPLEVAVPWEKKSAPAEEKQSG